MSHGTSQLKEISQNIRGMMVDEEGQRMEVEEKIHKNNSMIKETLGRIDGLLTSASGNVLCYTILFALIIVGLLYKMTK